MDTFVLELAGVRVGVRTPPAPGIPAGFPPPGSGGLGTISAIPAN